MSTHPRTEPPRPAVDERLVVPEQELEVVAGEVVQVSPSGERHGRRNAKLTSLLEALVVDEWLVASDMLTRTSRRDDFAPDASVYPEARHPVTGGRQLEALAFEVLDSQSLGSAGAKATSLAERGVRRVFAVDVRRNRVLEWSSATSAWSVLPSSGQIEDPLFVTPLVIEDLLSAARADDAMARALLAKQNPVIEAALALKMRDGLRDGRAAGVREALLAVFEERGLTPSAEQSLVIERAPVDHLLHWVTRAATASSVEAVLEVTEP